MRLPEAICLHVCVCVCVCVCAAAVATASIAAQVCASTRTALNMCTKRLLCEFQ